MASDENKPSKRGHTDMDSQKQNDVARKSGRVNHESSPAQEFEADEARKEAIKDDTTVNNEQKATRGKNGREDWGGYKGF